MTRGQRKRFITGRRLLGAWQRREALALATVTLLLAACGHPAEEYYPLEAGRSWSYVMSIRPASGQEVSARNEVINLPERTLEGQAVTPQASEAFGQRRVRFIKADDSAVVEIAEQDADAPQPQVKRPPNTILKVPLAVGSTWETTWETNQFGRRTLLPITKKVESADGGCTVPAGAFENCLHLRLEGSGPVSADGRPASVDVKGEEWFVPGVGYVRGIFMERVRGLPENDLGVEVTLIGRTP